LTKKCRNLENILVNYLFLDYGPVAGNTLYCINSVETIHINDTQH